jgi:hypothetical protein
MLAHAVGHSFLKPRSGNKVICLHCSISELNFHLRQKRPDILVGPHGGALLHTAPFRCRFTIAYAVSKRPTLLSSAVPWLLIC